MEDSGRPSFRSGGDRRLELVVSGRGHNNYGYNGSNQLYTNSTSTHPRAPDSQPVPDYSTSRSSDSGAKPWGLGDPEMKRRKRIARYKAYTVEGRVKRSIRNGLRWIKNKCSEIIHGY